MLEARGIGIGFPGVRAVSSVDFDLFSGEVHAVVGENGAGKSTLGRLLSGGLIGDEGSLSVSGVERRFASPREAIAAGIAIIPQELQLVASLTVADNGVLARGHLRLDHPLMQIRGRSCATRRARPACSAAATTAPTSL